MIHLHKFTHFITLQATLFVTSQRQGGLMQLDRPVLNQPSNSALSHVFFFHFQDVITADSTKRQIKCTELLTSSFLPESCLTTNPIIAFNTIFSDTLFSPWGYTFKVLPPAQKKYLQNIL